MSALYQAMFDLAPDALLLVDAAGRIVRGNGAAAAVLGYPSDELVGLSVDQLVPARVRSEHARFRSGYSNSPQARPMGLRAELVAVRRDGSEVKVEIALSPIELGDGARYTLAAIRDVGAYPRVQQALKRARFSEQAARMAQAVTEAGDTARLVATAGAIVAETLDVASSVVFLLEPGGEVLRVAGGVALLRDEQTGDTMPNRPDTPAGYVLAQAAPVQVPDYAGEQRFAVPASYRAAGLVSALAVPLADRGRIVGALSARATRPMDFGDEEIRFMQSIAGMLAASLLRLQAEERLQHAQRLESLGQLTGGVAHDFNNLLTVIQGNLQVLAERTEEPAHAALKAPVAAATRAARRGADLTARLLAFARRQVLRPDRVDSARLLHSLGGMLRRTLDERVLLQVQAGDAGPFCRADPAQLEGALLNMAINARDAMPDGGTLAFSARALEALPPEVAQAWPQLAGGRYVELAVRDSGHGMSDEVRARAFEPFFTTKEAGRGTGLGLASVYGFVQQSLGAITLDSAPGRGTTIRLYLPAWPEQAAPLPPPAHHAAVRRDLRVLLVEDDPDVRAVVRGYFAACATEVHACADAEEALAVLNAGVPLDLLLSDIALGPGLRGTELAERAAALRPGLAVLLMTGYDSAPALPVPRWTILAKPFDRETLLAALATFTTLLPAR